MGLRTPPQGSDPKFYPGAASPVGILRCCTLGESTYYHSETNCRYETGRLARFHKMRYWVGFLDERRMGRPEGECRLSIKWVTKGRYAAEQIYPLL